MKKYIRSFIIVIIFFLIINFFFYLFSDEKVVDYHIDEFDVKEHYLKDYDKYYFELSVDNNYFNLMINNNFNKKSYVIGEVYSFKNSSYSCVLPIFSDNNVYTDILCLHDGIIYPYRSLMNRSLDLDNFASEMKQYGYNVNLESLKEQKINNMSIYNNLNFSDIVVIPSYTGVYLINFGKDIIKSIDLFDKDIYEQTLNCLVSDYYLVADYNELYSFHEFYLVNLKNGKVSTLASDVAISMNSYIQGVVDDSVYLIDRSNKKQYMINISNKSVSIIGNTKKGIKYYDNGKFINKSMYDAINSDMVFKSNYIDSNKYDLVYNSSGVYYSYLKVKDGYDVYISYEKSPSVYSYATNIIDIDDVFYDNDSIYYIEKDCLYSYNLNGGKQIILSYSEFLYNDNLNFYIYEK